MTNSQTLKIILLLASATAGCDRTDSKADQLATCAMAPPSTGAPAANGAPAPSQSPTPVDQTQTSQRSVSVIVEQMSFQLCNARVNHWVDDEYYRREMTALRRASFSALGVKTADDALTEPSTKPADGPAKGDPEEANAL